MQSQRIPTYKTRWHLSYYATLVVSNITEIFHLALPTPSPTNPSNNIHQPYQYRHFNERPSSRSEHLIAIGPEGGYGNGDSELEIVTRSGEALSSAKLISEPKSISDEESKEEDDDKVNNEWRCDANNRDDLMDYLMALGREEDKYRASSSLRVIADRGYT
jgi:hypothetical protein